MNKVNELAVWDFAESFTALDAVGLILGVGNHHSLMLHERELPYKRMTQAFEAAKEQLHQAFVDADIPFEGNLQVEIPERNSRNLHSLRDEEARTRPTNDNFALAGIEQIDEAVFSREEIHRWLEAIKVRSIYEFSPSVQAPELITDDRTQKVEQAELEIDPSDYPNELDAANMAFRAIAKGYGDQTKTARNRLVDYLNERYPEFRQQQRERIATVANPDKTTGRKKSNSL
jgi:hypothetical protein